MQTGAILGKGKTARMVWAGDWSWQRPGHLQGYFLCHVLQTTWADQFPEPLLCDMDAATFVSAFDTGWKVFFLFSHLFKRIVFNLGHCDKFFSKSFWAVNSIKQESSPCCQSWEGLQWFFHVVVLSLGQLAELLGVLSEIPVWVGLVQKLQARGDPKNVTPQFPPFWKFVEVLGIALDFPQFVGRKIPVCIRIQSPQFTDREAEAHRTRSHPWTLVPAWTRNQVFQLQSASPRYLRVDKFWGKSWWGGCQAHSSISLVYPGQSDRIRSWVCTWEEGQLQLLPLLVLMCLPLSVAKHTAECSAKTM